MAPVPAVPAAAVSRELCQTQIKLRAGVTGTPRRYILKVIQHGTAASLTAGSTLIAA
jgi:hypothetical protein